MRLTGFLLLLLGIFSDYTSFAQIKGELTQSRILIILDESSSMIQKWPSGKPKYIASHEIILNLMDSIYAVNNQVEFSLRVIGHQHTVPENNCYDTKNEVAFSRDNRVQMALRLEDIHPLGVTPLAYSLEQAAEHDLVDEQHNAYSIILITDGGESCGGNICEVMKKLSKSKVYFRPYIVSLEDDPTLKVTYSCMGDYLQVTKDGDIPKAVNTIVEAFRPIIKLSPAEYKQMQIVAAKAPSVLKVNVPSITTKEPDSSRTVKTWKDSVTASVPEHKIKVDEPPKPLPRPEKMVDLSPAHLKQYPVTTAKAATFTTVSNTVKLPPLVIDTPVPPPVVITIPKTEKMVRTAIAKTQKLTIEATVVNTPKTAGLPLLPPLVIETPPPPPVVINIPKTDKMVRTAPARSKMFPLEVTVIRAPKTVGLPSLPQLVVETPSPPPVVITIPKTDKMVRTPPARSKMFPLEVTVIRAPKTVGLPSLPPLVIETPPPPPVVITIPKTDKLTRTAPARTRTLAIEHTTAKTLKTASLPSLPPLVIETPPPPPVVITIPKTEKMVRTKPSGPKKLMTLIIVETRPFETHRLPPLPPLKIEVPKTPPAKLAKGEIAVPPGKKLDYDIKTEDARESTLEVYIVNSRGLPVATSPQIVLIDQVTQKVGKQFHRTVDPNGNPDPQTGIPVGIYTLSFPAKKNLIIPNVHIEPNKRNKITVRVKNVSLSFAYLGAPDRPVKEFGARVIEREKQKGRVQDQLCTTTLEYEPGNYHIRINTFPEDVRNVDLDLDENTQIMILQPGFVKFTCDIKQTVTLDKEDGNKYMAFHQLDLNDPISQNLRIQPGKYRVHYHLKGPKGVTLPEKVLPFVITSNQTTEVVME